MFTSELNTFIKEQRERLKKYYNVSDQQTITLAGAVKLSEEVGELCAQILASVNLARKEKIQNHNINKLEEEFADVLITTLILAHTMNIDTEKALKDKIAIVTKRFS